MANEKSGTSYHEAIIQAWDCVLAGASAVYLSGPITTGLKHAKELRRGADAASLQHVKRSNINDLIATAKKLRRQRAEIVIEPASLHLPEWSQADYHLLWERLIERHIKLAIFMPGWEYSLGCAIEFAHAISRSIRTESLSGAPISLDAGIALLAAARDDLRADNADGALTQQADALDDVVERLQGMLRPSELLSQNLRKDASLDTLAERGLNVAQFVSFEPHLGLPRQAYCRVSGLSPNNQFPGLRSALEILLRSSATSSINVRSYEPHDPQSREFIYGLKSVESAAAAVERLSQQGLCTIVNETIDIADGGVSGVLMGNVLEFAPDDTPRCVEKPGTASLPRYLGLELLSTVYGFPVEFAIPFASRLEFSLHPRPCGWLTKNIITWEFSEQESIDVQPQMGWPNRFSRLIGDKCFGLLIADQLGLPVPRTTVVNRRIAPFCFGRATGWNEHWIRTAPPEPMPGLFATRRGWTDPFALLFAEDPQHNNLSSVLSQSGVYPAYSGALIVGADGRLIIEGRAGTGISLMLNEDNPEPLPSRVTDDVERVYKLAEAALGPVRLEWVHDGKDVWVVQLHRGATETTHLRLTQGDATQWVEFDVNEGLPALRLLLAQLAGDTGLILKGRVGLTSHVADVIRKSGIPTKMAA